LCQVKCWGNEEKRESISLNVCVLGASAEIDDPIEAKRREIEIDGVLADTTDGKGSKIGL
jgi:hypothetical protein